MRAELSKLARLVIAYHERFGRHVPEPTLRRVDAGRLAAFVQDSLVTGAVCVGMLGRPPRLWCPRSKLRRSVSPFLISAAPVRPRSSPRNDPAERPQQTGLQPLPAAKRTGAFDPNRSHAFGIVTDCFASHSGHSTRRATENKLHPSVE
jgi:hypothetical protein